MKKGNTKFIATLNCNNSEMLSNAVSSIDIRTKSGVTKLKFIGNWNGLNFDKLEFMAMPHELSKIKDEVETEFGILVS